MRLVLIGTTHNKQNSEEGLANVAVFELNRWRGEVKNLSRIINYTQAKALNLDILNWDLINEVLFW